MSNIEIIYTNGSSFTAGGGLEPFNEAMNEYVGKYDIEPWSHEKEVAWPSWIEYRLNTTIINEAESGGGLSRVIRMTYDFVHKNWDKKNSLLILLEIPQGLRLDVYYTPLDSFLIVNYNDSGFSKESVFYGTTQYFRETDYEKEIYNQKIQDVDYYCKTFLNIQEFDKIEKYHLEGLISYCKLHDIQILTTEQNFITHNFNTEGIIEESPFMYCLERKMTVKNETHQGNDLHPGYFGHKEYSQYLLNQLVYKGFIDKSYLNLNSRDKCSKII